VDDILTPAPGILDLVADHEKIESFLRHQIATGKQQHEPDQYAEMEAYLHSEEYRADLERLKKGDYFFPAPFHYRIKKNASGKKRDVYAFKGPALYILRMVSWVLHDYDDSMFPSGLYSFRRNVHAKDFLKKIRSFRNLNRFWIIKSDVSNYVGSIVPEIIIPRLEKMWGHDPALLGLLKFILLRRECIERDGSVVACEPGGLGGLPVANFFMNVYLMEMDLYFNGRSPLYCRYSDDIIILARSREEAEDYVKTFYEILAEKRLYTNPDKTQLIEPGGSVEVLGFLVTDGLVDLSDHAMDKICHKIRKRANRLLRYKDRVHLDDRVVGEKMVRFCNRVFYGTFQPHELCWARWYFPIINTAERLKQIDRYAQDAIRLVMNGSMHKRRYNVRYEELQALGYRSLVHAYYHTDPEHWL
jgi:hypothetical protein